ncbi:hypothetical protein SALBM135S_09484 [Streptomyces alboniger]
MPREVGLVPGQLDVVALRHGLHGLARGQPVEARPQRLVTRHERLPRGAQEARVEWTFDGQDALAPVDVRPVLVERGVEQHAFLQR